MFKPEQHVIHTPTNTLYIFRRNCTSTGEETRHSTGHCKFALVNLPNSDKPIVLPRASLSTVADVVPPPAVPAVKPAPVKQSTPDVFASIKADALVAQAERLEGYAKQLRSEAHALRGNGW